MISTIIEYLQNNRIIVANSDPSSITTEHKIGTISISIIGFISGNFPLSLPKFYLCKRNSFGLLAHVGWPDDNDAGLICGGATDALSLNYHFPERLYFEALNKVISTIKPVLLDKTLNIEECLNEFVGHWHWAAEREKNKVLILGSPSVFIQPLTIKYPIRKSYIGLGNRIIAYTGDFDDLSEHYNVRLNCEDKKRMIKGKGCLIDIPELIPPPPPKEAISDWWKRQIMNLGESLQTKLSDFAHYSKSTECWIVIHSKNNKKAIWFALKCTTINNKQKSKLPLSIDNLSYWNISAIESDVHTREILLPRAGLNKALSERKVTIVGCGSIGSIIAEQMASSGIGHLNLIDIDVFESVNLYRHVLDMSWLDAPKAHALTKVFENKYPFTKFECDLKNIKDITLRDINETDIIIVAIGNPTYELFFNEKLVNNNINIPSVYCWVEPYGIGGHVILNSGNYNEGCLACNYFDPNTDTPALSSNMNFLEPNQNIVEDVGGCGSLYLPYSNLDAMQTALLTSKLALNTLTEKLNKTTRISWKGYPSSLRNLEKIKFTHRYYKFNETIRKENYFKEENCPVCRKYHS
jgi:molybdopterin/thiamine biosynthesis adenylyltransferase